MLEAEVDLFPPPAPLLGERFPAMGHWAAQAEMAPVSEVSEPGALGERCVFNGRIFISY